jgi:multidrug efflux system membrane fusion protein
MTRVRDLNAHRFDCAVVLIMAAALVSCGGSEPPPQREVVRPVKLLTVSSGMASAPRVYPGRIEAKDRVELSFRVGGPLIEFPVREGASVKAGGVVARIDPRDFRIRLEAAQAERERTTADFGRHASLYAKDAVSQLQLDQTRAAMEVAQARLDDARAALKDTTLYAPYSAQVAQRLVDNYQEVRPGQPIVSLVSLGEMKVEVDLPEGMMSRSLEGVSGRIVATIDAAPDREFELRLLERALQADSVTGTYRATFVMPQPEGMVLLPGMAVQVIAYPYRQDARPVIPAVAIASGPEGAMVWVVDRDSMTVSSRAVTTGGLTGSDSVEVLAGLEPGETIATSAVQSLRDGMTIRQMDE